MTVLTLTHPVAPFSEDIQFNNEFKENHLALTSLKIRLISFTLLIRASRVSIATAMSEDSKNIQLSKSKFRSRNFNTVDDDEE